MRYSDKTTVMGVQIMTHVTTTRLLPRPGAGVYDPTIPECLISVAQLLTVGYHIIFRLPKDCGTDGFDIITYPHWCNETYSSSDPPHGRRRPYQEPSRSCSYAAPWSYARPHSFLRSSSSLVLLCLLLPSGENPSKYGGEWLIPPYIGINPYISPAKKK